MKSVSKALQVEAEYLMDNADSDDQTVYFGDVRFYRNQSRFDSLWVYDLEFDGIDVFFDEKEIRKIECDNEQLWGTNLNHWIEKVHAEAKTSITDRQIIAEQESQERVDN